MILVHVVHRADDRDLVDHLGRVRQQFAHPRAALAVAGKLPVAAHHLALHAAPGRGDFGKFLRSIRTMKFLQRRFGIKQIHLRRPTLHAELNHRLSPRRKVRLARTRVHWQRRLMMRLYPVQIAREQRRQGRAVQTVLDAVEKLSAVDGVRIHLNRCTKTPRY